jgi:hypothetical protein
MMVSWQQWLAKGDVKTHQTSKQEIDNLRALITRDLADAAVVALSADRRFADLPLPITQLCKQQRLRSPVLDTGSVLDLDTTKLLLKLQSLPLAVQPQR